MSWVAAISQTILPGCCPPGLSFLRLVPFGVSDMRLFLFRRPNMENSSTHLLFSPLGTAFSCLPFWLFFFLLPPPPWALKEDYFLHGIMF